eukprot:gb/GECG01007035.1/.p1 GENE.gb/GECG01007035.1/~~gb/GECG01007035.1/.p1  ORF type:complete len:1167 (+),score=159.06 gb/GECG01007035.1/:1-3501(+)
MTSIDNFENILQALTTPNNDERRRAEQILEECKQRPDALLTSLIQATRHSNSPEIRALAAVILRRIISSEEPPLLPKCSENTQNTLCDELIKGIQHEEDSAIRKKLTDTTGELALILLPDNKWNNLMPTLFHWVTKENLMLREMALRIFEQLSMYFVNHMQAHFSEISRIFESCFLDGNVSSSVRVAAVRAAGTLIICLDTGASVLSKLANLAAPFCAVVSNLLASNDMDRAKQVVSVLIDIADAQPTFFKGTLDDTLRLMLTITDKKDLPNDIRRLSLEFVVTLAEGAPAMARKQPHNGFVRRTLPVVFNLMLEHPEDPEWSCREESEESDPKSNVTVAEECLGRIGHAIGAKKFFPIMLPFVSPFLQNNEWQYRYAGLSALTQVSDLGLEKHEQLDHLGKQILPYFNDNSERVRYAAVTAVGMFCLYKGDTFLRDNHEAVVSALLQGVRDPCKRVQAQSAGAIVNFAQAATSSTLQHYVGQLMQSLYILLRDGGRTCKEWGISAISAVAESATVSVRDYYSDLMSVLLPIIQASPEQLKNNSSNERSDLRLLRGKAVECASVVGVAVGAELFRKDAKSVMQSLLQANETAQDPDDPTRSYLWQAWGRVASVLKEDFAPYMDMVLPSLLQGAAADVGYHKLTDEEADEAREMLSHFDEDSDEENQIVEEDDGLVRVKTSALEDKITAISMLSSLSADMKGYFKPYVKQVIDVLTPVFQLKGTVFEDARVRAAEALPNLVAAANSRSGYEALQASNEDLKHLLEISLKSVAPKMVDELNMDVLLVMLACIKQCVEGACQEVKEASSSTPVTPAADGGTNGYHHEQSSLHKELDPVVPLGFEEPTKYQPLLDQTFLREVSQSILSVQRKSSQRRAVLYAEMQTNPDDFDEEANEEQYTRMMQEDELQSSCMDVLGTLLKTHTSVFMQVMKNDILPTLVDLVKDGSTEGDLRAAIFLMDDILEFGGQEGQAYWHDFKPYMMRGCDGENPALRQASVYGLGVAGENCGERFVNDAPEILAKLKDVADKIDPGQDDDETVHDNAVCAVAKIVQNLPSNHDIDCRSYISWWLAKLPLRSDAEESRVCMKILCTRMESGCPYVVGSNGENLPHILTTIADVISDEDLCTVALAARFRYCLQQVQTIFPGDAWGWSFKQISNNSQVMLNELVK